MKWVISVLLVLSFNAHSFELYLVRHFEKQADKTDPELTERGLLRADSLSKLLADKDIKRIYSTEYNRTLQTAEPLSETLDIPITAYSPKKLNELAKRLLASAQNSLIVGHSNTTPELLSALGGNAKPIAEDEYGELFLLIVLPNTVITQSVKVGNP